MELPGWISLAGALVQMRISWIASHTHAWPVDVNIDDIKNVGPIWSSWRAWRACHSDNVVCDDLGHARALLARAFQAVCNLHLPRRLYQDLTRPQGVRWYDGAYQEQVQCIDDIIAMHLSAQHSDVILLTGFDFGRSTVSGDAVQDHMTRNQKGLARQVILDNPLVQWVVLDHAPELDPAFADIANFTRDSMQNALKLLT